MVTRLLNSNASQLDDLILKIHWLLRQLEFEFSLFIIDEVQSLGLRFDVLTKKDQINSLGRLSWLKVSPPGDELE